MACFSGWLMLWVGVTSCSRSSETHLFRYAHGQPEAALRSESMRHFKKIVEERSQGRLQVELYLEGFGHRRELMDYVTMGEYFYKGLAGPSIGMPILNFQLFTLPFLVANWDEAIALIQSPFTAALNQKAKEQGFHSGHWHFPGLSRPTPANIPSTRDSQGAGACSSTSRRPCIIGAAEAFGTTAGNPCHWIYQALKTGVVDGQDNPPPKIFGIITFAVSKYVTVTHYSTGPDPFMVHLGWYESLPEDLRKSSIEAARESVALSDQLNRDMEQQYLDHLADHLEVNILNRSPAPAVSGSGGARL